MIKVGLCDDNEIIRRKYAAWIRQISEKHKVPVQLMEFASGEQLIFHMDQNPNEMDLIYMDILMGQINGIETTKKLREMGCRSEIVFLTTEESFVFESFDTSPLHYLIKQDVKEKEFERVFLKAVEQAKQKEEELFCCENGGKIRQVPIKEIAYFEIRNRIVTMHEQKGNFDFYARLDQLEGQLKEKNFIRVHRSYLVQLSYIEQIGRDLVILITGEQVPVGMTYSKNLKLAMSQYLSRTF